MERFEKLINLARKVELRKAWFLKRLQQFKINKVIYTAIIGKMP
jgi:hypothetical protein